MYTDPRTGELRTGIQKVSYKHEECIKILVEEPFISQGELAARFGVTQAWMSQVMSSDAFKARLAEMKDLVHGPALATVSERLQALAHASLDKLLDKIAGPAAMPKDETLLKAIQLSTSALGYGARNAEAARATAQVVIQLPGKAESVSQWAEKYTPGGVVDVQVREVGTPVPLEKREGE